MLKFTLQPSREALDSSAPVTDQFCSHHNMSEQLAVVCVIIFRERRNFLQFADIVESRCRKQKIRVQIRILNCHEITDFNNAQRMLQKSSDKTVMDGLRRGMLLKSLLKTGISEILPDQLLQIRVFSFSQTVHQFSVHLIDVLFTHRKIVRRIVFAGIGAARPLDIQLR